MALIRRSKQPSRLVQAVRRRLKDMADSEKAGPMQAYKVIRYVRRHKNRLSPLSKREALRIAIQEGLIPRLP